MPLKLHCNAFGHVGNLRTMDRNVTSSVNISACTSFLRQFFGQNRYDIYSFSAYGVYLFLNIDPTHRRFDILSIGWITGRSGMRSGRVGACTRAETICNGALRRSLQRWSLCGPGIVAPRKGAEISMPARERRDKDRDQRQPDARVQAC